MRHKKIVFMKKRGTVLKVFVREIIKILCPYLAIRNYKCQITNSPVSRQVIIEYGVMNMEQRSEIRDQRSVREEEPRKWNRKTQRV